MYPSGAEQSWYNEIDQAEWATLNVDGGNANEKRAQLFELEAAAGWMCRDDWSDDDWCGRLPHAGGKHVPERSDFRRVEQISRVDGRVWEVIPKSDDGSEVSGRANTEQLAAGAAGIDDDVCG